MARCKPHAPKSLSSSRGLSASIKPKVKRSSESRLISIRFLRRGKHMSRFLVLPQWLVFKSSNSIPRNPWHMCLISVLKPALALSLRPFLKSKADGCVCICKAKIVEFLDGQRGRGWRTVNYNQPLPTKCK
jgi:hypothetical protein